MSAARKPRRVVILALAAIAVAAMVRAGAHDRVAATWVEAKTRPIAIEVPFTGRLRALGLAEYGPPALTEVWEYRITFIAPEGSTVEAGEPVLQFDTADLEERRRRRVAERDAADKEYEQRRKDFEAEISEQGLAIDEARALERRAEVVTEVPAELMARTKRDKAAVDLDLAREEVAHRGERIQYLERRSATELAALRDRRDRAAAAVRDIEQSIASMTVRASSPGTVSHCADRRGLKKKTGDTCWRGDRVLEIPQPGALSVDAWVDEARSGALAVGLPAALRLETHPDRPLRATIESLQHAVERPRELDGAPVVRLELALAGGDAELVRPGMRVQGTIEIEPPRVAIAVPVDAVEPGPDGPYVMRKTWLGAERRAVEVGRRSGGSVEIASGLAEGDRVLVTP